VTRATPPFFFKPSRQFTAVTVSVGTVGVYGVRNSVEFTEKNVRTDLDAMQEMVSMNSQATPTTVIDGEVVIGFDKGKIDTLLGL
jgi:glutaredoxin 3